MQLRITRRAAVDLAIDPDRARLDARKLVDDHAVVRAFVERRSQHPRGQEATFVGGAPGPLDNLHVGGGRGLTWHDVEAGVVWLLGFLPHNVGDDDSAVYERLKARHRSGKLMPGEDDYLALEPDADSFVDAASTEVPRIVQKAFANPGTEVRDVIGDALDVGVLVEVIAIDTEELAELWVAFRMPPHAERPLPPHYLAVVAAMFFPETEAADLFWGDPFPRSAPASGHEVVVHGYR